MFKNKKMLECIKEERLKLEKEKEELLFIKECLNNDSPKIDISDLYIWHDKGIYYIVRLDVTYIKGRTFGGVGKIAYGYDSILTDIFTNRIIYQKTATEKINNKQYIRGNSLEDGYFAYFYPIHEADRNLLAYTNKQVPLYILQQLYYRLNRIDVNAKILKKEK